MEGTQAPKKDSAVRVREPKNESRAQNDAENDIEGGENLQGAAVGPVYVNEARNQMQRLKIHDSEAATKMEGTKAPKKDSDGAMRVGEPKNESGAQNDAENDIEGAENPQGAAVGLAYLNEARNKMEGLQKPGSSVEMTIEGDTEEPRAENDLECAAEVGLEGAVAENPDDPEAREYQVLRSVWYPETWRSYRLGIQHQIPRPKLLSAQNGANASIMFWQMYQGRRLMNPELFRKVVTMVICSYYGPMYFNDGTYSDSSFLDTSLMGVDPPYLFYNPYLCNMSSADANKVVSDMIRTLTITRRGFRFIRIGVTALVALMVVRLLRYNADVVHKQIYNYATESIARVLNHDGLVIPPPSYLFWRAAGDFFLDQQMKTHFAVIVGTLLTAFDGKPMDTKHQVFKEGFGTLLYSSRMPAFTWYKLGMEPWGDRKWEFFDCISCAEVDESRVRIEALINDMQYFHPTWKICRMIDPGLFTEFRQPENIHFCALMAVSAYNGNEVQVHRSFQNFAHVIEWAKEKYKQVVAMMKAENGN